VAFAEQFIYLCLRHLTVLLWSARGARIGISARIRGRQINKIDKSNDRGTIRTPSLSKDNFHADRTSGGLPLSAAALLAKSALAKSAANSRSVPFVGGARA